MRKIRVSKTKGHPPTRACRCRCIRQGGFTVAPQRKVICRSCRFSALNSSLFTLLVTLQKGIFVMDVLDWLSSPETYGVCRRLNVLFTNSARVAAAVGAPLHPEAQRRDLPLFSVSQPSPCDGSSGVAGQPNGLKWVGNACRG